jgi:hypothetical protein
MAKITPSLFMALLVCGSSKPAREQLHRSEIEPDLTAGDGGLKVFGEAAVAVEPSEGSFDHPAARQDTRAGTIGPFDDLNSPPAVSGQCRGQLIAGIAVIGKTWRNQGNRWRIDANRPGAIACSQDDRPQAQPPRQWMKSGFLVALRSACGATLPLPSNPAKVASLNRQRPFSLGCGNRSSCPRAATPSRHMGGEFVPDLRTG